MEELEAAAASAGGPPPGKDMMGGTVKGGPPTKSIVKLKAERLEKAKALRLVQQVRATV